MSQSGVERLRSMVSRQSEAHRNMAQASRAVLRNFSDLTPERREALEHEVDVHEGFSSQMDQVIDGHETVRGMITDLKEYKEEYVNRHGSGPAPSHAVDMVMRSLSNIDNLI